jgi:hypothetical protein
MNKIVEKYAYLWKMNKIVEKYAYLCKMNKIVEKYAYLWKMNKIVEKYSYLWKKNKIIEKYSYLWKKNKIVEKYAYFWKFEQRPTACALCTFHLNHTKGKKRIFSLHNKQKQTSQAIGINKQILSHQCRWEYIYSTTSSLTTILQ